MGARRAPASKLLWEAVCVNLQPYLSLSDEASAALRAGRPVVALDSTSAAHDMPPGMGLGFALAKERAVREAGAVPATVAVLDGRLCIGLSPRQLERVCTAPALGKASRRELPILLATGTSAAATASAAMLAAVLAGIPVFAAAGIGGVREGLDISADLQELSRSSLAVVCAGPKPGCDEASTVEYLETKGVPVLGLGGAVLPAFWCAGGALSADAAVEDEHLAARIARTKWDLGLAGGVLLACGPAPGQALDGALAARALADAREAARAQNLRGRALTPFIMAHILAACPQAQTAYTALSCRCAAAASRLAAALRARR